MSKLVKGNATFGEVFKSDSTLPVRICENCAMAMGKSACATGIRREESNGANLIVANKETMGRWHRLAASVFDRSNVLKNAFDTRDFRKYQGVNG